MASSNERTDWDVSIWSDRELLHDTFRANTGFLEVAKHLIGCCLFWSGSSCHLHGMIFCFVGSHSLYIRRDLALVHLGLPVYFDIHSISINVDINSPVESLQEHALLGRPT